VDGFFRQAIDNFVVSFYKNAQEAVNAGTNFQETISYKVFKRFFEGCKFNGELLSLERIVETTDDGNLRISNEAVEAIQEYLTTAEGKNAKFEVTKIVCMGSAIWNPYSYTTPPSTPIEDLFNGSIGLTGTTFNKSSYPMCIGTLYSPQAGSLGAVCVKFAENNKNKLSRIHAMPSEIAGDQSPDGANQLTAEKLLKQWKNDVSKATKTDEDARKTIQNLRIIVDSGSTLVAQKTSSIIRDIANFIRSENLEVSHIEWFDELRRNGD
jgi:hypothetical protein